MGRTLLPLQAPVALNASPVQPRSAAACRVLQKRVPVRLAAPGARATRSGCQAELASAAADGEVPPCSASPCVGPCGHRRCASAGRCNHEHATTQYVCWFVLLLRLRGDISDALLDPPARSRRSSLPPPASRAILGLPPPLHRCLTRPPACCTFTGGARAVRAGNKPTAKRAIGGLLPCRTRCSVRVHLSATHFMHPHCCQRAAARRRLSTATTRAPTW